MSSLSQYNSKYSRPDMPVTNFVVTGFGPFAGVKANPTQALVEWLEQQNGVASLAAAAIQQPQRDAAKQQHGSYKIVSCTVLEVSAVAVDNYLENQAALLQDACRQADKQPVVLLHLGVDTQRNGLNLEFQAYNNATFRCPDQAGWQPSGLVIEPGDGLGLNSVRCTALPVEQFAQKLHEAGFDCHGSHDAGRFVCNYIYHKSLQLTTGLQYKQQRQQQVLVQQSAGAGAAAADAAPQPPTSSSSSSNSLIEASANREEGTGSNDPTVGMTRGSSGTYFKNGAAALATASAAASTADACADIPVYSLFVHVPPFAAIPEDKQREFLLALLQAIASWLNSR